MVTIASSAENANDLRTKAAFFIVEPNQKQLSIIADLHDEGRLRTVVDAAIPLTRATEAIAERRPGVHRGKVMMKIAEED